MNREVTEYDVLARAHELLQQGWCQGVFSRSEKGREVRSVSRSAASWCLLGATVRAGHELGTAHTLVWDCDARIARLLDQSCIHGWNDDPERTHAEVLAVVARAADEARREGEK